MDNIKKGINYSAETSKYIGEKEDKYCEYITSYEKNYENNSTMFNGLDYKERNLENFKQVLEVLGVKEVSSIAFYHVIKFISNESGNISLISINCDSAVGKSLVEKAINIMYSNYI